MIPVVGLTTRTVVLRRKPIFDRTQIVSEPYLLAVRRAGAVPVLVPSDAGLEEAGPILSRLDGLIVTGGGDVDAVRFGRDPHPRMGVLDPLRDEIEIELTRQAVKRDLPFLGICRGHQILNVALGGTLIQDLGTAGIEGLIQHEVRSFIDGRGHFVTIQDGTRLADAVGAGKALVTSTHHQAVDGLGEGLIVTARASDGVIEAVEHPGLRFFIGVQWHPERMTRPDGGGERLFRAFVTACRGAGS